MRYIPARLTHHWHTPYTPARLHALPIINTRLHAFTFINKRLTHLCLVLLQIPLCLSTLEQKKFNMKQIFSFRPEKPFLDKFDPKNENCRSKLKFGTKAIWIWRIQWFNGDVHFFSSRPEIPILGKFVQKIKIFSLSWNLVLMLIVCKIQWWCSLFLFSTRNTLFGQICPKNQNCQFELKFGTYTNYMQNSMVMFTFSIFDQKYLFLNKFGPKNQNFQFKLKCGT